MAMVVMVMMAMMTVMVMVAAMITIVTMVAVTMVVRLRMAMVYLSLALEQPVKSTGEHLGAALRNT